MVQIADIRQSPHFAAFMESIGWNVVSVGGTYAYLRKFPLIGCFAKIPRPSTLSHLDDIESILKQNRAFHIKVSPFITVTDPTYQDIKRQFGRKRFAVDMQPFNPTTTIRIDLRENIDTLFTRFSPAKRRAVRRAQKNGVTVSESEDIDSFIAIRRHQYKPMGFLVVSEMKYLFKAFYPNNSSLLLAYSGKNRPVAGILMLFHDGVAYYWYASALPEGKKLFAPTLLVFEALKTAKKKGCTLYDFEGICDARFPKASQSWRGFTKFKEGFHNRPVIFAENFYRFQVFP